MTAPQSAELTASPSLVGQGSLGTTARVAPYAERRGGKCRCRWCRGKAGWNVHHGYILHLIGMEDADIARELGIAESAVAKRRRSAWAFGRA